MNFPAIAAAVGAAYLIVQVVQMTVVWELMTSTNDCQSAAVEALQSPYATDLSSAEKKTEIACARLEANAEVAERIMRRLP